VAEGEGGKGMKCRDIEEHLEWFREKLIFLKKHKYHRLSSSFLSSNEYRWGRKRKTWTITFRFGR